MSVLQAVFLRRHYPDQVPRVLSQPAAFARAPLTEQDENREKQVEGKEGRKNVRKLWVRGESFEFTSGKNALTHFGACHKAGVALAEPCIAPPRNRSVRGVADEGGNNVQERQRAEGKAQKTSNAKDRL